MILRHMGITVSNLEEALFFYRDLLSLSVVKIMNEKGPHIDAFSNLVDVDVTTVKLKDSHGAMIELLYYHSHKFNYQFLIYCLLIFSLAVISKISSILFFLFFVF